MDNAITVKGRFMKVNILFIGLLLSSVTHLAVNSQAMAAESTPEAGSQTDYYR